MDSVELKTCGIVTYIPENTISVKMTVQYMNNDGMIITVKKSMSPSEIYTAMKDYEENYVDQDSIYVIVDKVRKYLEEGEVS